MNKENVLIKNLIIDQMNNHSNEPITDKLKEEVRSDILSTFKKEKIFKNKGIDIDVRIKTDWECTNWLNKIFYNLLALFGNRTKEYKQTIMRADVIIIKD